MSAIADIGAVIEVSPADWVWVQNSALQHDYIEDRTKFRFRVQGRLEDGQIFYGLFGRVMSGPERYQDLICNITVRLDASDWRVEEQSQANFKVGTNVAYRDHAFDFRHPEGTKIDGYPVFGRFAWIEVMDGKYPRKRREFEEHAWRDGIVRASS
jgi:hypothetical protein